MRPANNGFVGTLAVVEATAGGDESASPAIEELESATTWCLPLVRRLKERDDSRDSWSVGTRLQVLVDQQDFAPIQNMSTPSRFSRRKAPKMNDEHKRQTQRH